MQDINAHETHSDWNAIQSTRRYLMCSSLHCDQISVTTNRCKCNLHRHICEIKSPLHKYKTLSGLIFLVLFALDNKVILNQDLQLALQTIRLAQISQSSIFNINICQLAKVLVPAFMIRLSSTNQMVYMHKTLILITLKQSGLVFFPQILLKHQNQIEIHINQHWCTLSNRPKLCK